MTKIKPKITKYMDNCIICGAPASWHHCLHGSANRKLAGDDGLLLPLCPKHHQYSDVSAHVNNTVDILCQIIGELAYERNFLADELSLALGANRFTSDDLIAESRNHFMKRYGKARL